MDKGQSKGKRKRAEEGSSAGASTSSSISSGKMGVGSDQYDVFLSFRGSDTRKEFTDHLYHSLRKVGTVQFCVFKDDQSIPIGKEFGPHILDAIVRSKISIPIISENYASSKWCLRELTCILGCKKSISQVVLPIFYKVAPFELRRLEGNFGKAFHSIQKPFDEKDIQDWQRALHEVSKLHGWESQKIANGHEGELIELVVETVRSKLQDYFQLDVPKQLVGLDDPLKEIMNWIESPSINARMLGIYGMGGIGKTTLAKCIYNQLLNKFVHASFLPDVRETIRRQGIMYLQGLLISDITNEKNEVSRVDDGINKIKSIVKRKKVLILLDDIDDKDQLDALARECDWFVEGSLIIITTRNKTVLDQSEFEVVYKYGLNELVEAQALLLFNRHAFRVDQSTKDFEDVSRDIISTMGGLPLALKVVGSQLYGKTDRKVWEDVRKKLKSQQHRDVQKILLISYDALDNEHKQIFLDIACFFIDECSGHAMYMWDACGFYPSEGIEELKLRCLIKTGEHGIFKMHDQLRDLGRSIFCQRQPLEERSGPWDKDYKGIARVVRPLRQPCFYAWLEAALSGDSNELLSEVRWLQWVIKESDLSLWTTNLRLPNLLVLQLIGGQMTEDWEGWSSVRTSTQLQLLHLQLCNHLRFTPDLSSLSRLKNLYLILCEQLEHLHPSIGKLKSLVSLYLTDCERLKELPDEVGELDNLEELGLAYSGITKIPTSIGSLKKLKKLRLIYCKSLRGIPTSIGDLQDLQHLDMSWSLIEKLPNSIGRLKNLKTLKITHTPIFDVPELPSGLTSLSISCQSPRLPQLSSLTHLEKLSIEKCSSIERLDLSHLIHLKQLQAKHCNNLVEVQGLDKLELLEDVCIDGCNSIKSLLFSESRGLKKLEAIECNNLVEIQGLNGVRCLKERRILDYGFRLCQIWQYMRS